MEHQAELGKPPFFGTALEYCRENQAVQKRLGSDWEDWIQEALTEILVEGKDVTIGYVINRAHCRRIDFFRCKFGWENSKIYFRHRVSTFITKL